MRKEMMITAGNSLDETSDSWMSAEKDKDIDFLIFYEVKTREIDSISLLRNELVNRGHTVEILCFAEAAYPLRFMRFRNRVKVAIMPSLYHSEEIMQHVYFALGKVDNIVNLQWEQIWTMSTEHDPTAYSYPKEAAVHAYHLCWGFQEAENMRNASIAEDKLLVTGPLHMDFYRKEFTDALGSRDVVLRRYGIDPSKMVILFISSYVFGSSFSVGSDHNLSEKEQSYVTTLEWIEKVLLEFGDEIEFVYRPHPVEIENPLIIDLSRRYSNLHVNSEATIKEWIQCSDRVCTWVSTSIADTYFAGVPCAILRPVPLPNELEMATYRNARLTDTYDGFRDFVRHGGSMAADAEVIELYYNTSDEESVACRVSDALEKILLSAHRFPWDDLPVKEFDATFALRVLKKRVRGLFYRCCNRAFPIMKAIDSHVRLAPTRFANKFGQQWLGNIASEEELMRTFERWDV